MIVCTKCANEGKIVDGTPGISLNIPHTFGGLEFTVKPEIKCVDAKMHLCNVCLLEAFSKCDIDSKIKETLINEQKALEASEKKEEGNG